MSRTNFLLWLAVIIQPLITALLAFTYRDRLWPSGGFESSANTPTPSQVLELSPQARKNLGLLVQPIKLQNYWRAIQIPGTVVDRPGVSDRGITAPAVGVVAKIHAFPGNTVKPGDKLVTLRLISEYLQNAQSELFKSTRETQLVAEQLKRLESAAKTGAIAELRILEFENQLRRLSGAIQSYRQDLLSRGLTQLQIERVAEGQFVAEIEVLAPPQLNQTSSLTLTPNSENAETAEGAPTPHYELQSLKVELGQQVQAGQTLCELANHQALYIEGHSFKREAPYLEQAAQQNWPLTVDFAEAERDRWPPFEQQLSIRHLANAVDTDSRTFSFFVPLENQSRQYEQEGHAFWVWRYRPGQRVRLQVPLEEFRNVLIVPIAAVVREGADAFVFRQNGNLFNRTPVQVLYEDRQNAILANDGSVAPGWYLAQNCAASLNRVLKAQAASGVPAGVHVHPDGTVHGAH